LRRKLFIISFLLIITAVLGPAIYAQKVSHLRQAPELSAAINKAAALNGGRQAESKPAALPESSNQEKNGQETASPPAPDYTGAAVRQINTNSGSRDTSGQKKESSANEVQTDPDSGPADGKKQAGSTTSAKNEPGGKEKDKGCPVEIAVIGMNGELLYGPEKITVTEKNFGGITALGALDATGLSYTTSRRWAVFVEAIAGQRNRGQAGWMYQVNGEIPPAGADRKPLNAGDQVIWWYSKRIDSRPPAWDQLCKQ